MSRNLLTKDQFRAIAGVSPAAGGTVTLFGKQVPWFPLSVGHYCQYVLGRFECAKSFYVLGAQIAVAKEGIDQVEAEGREPTVDDVKALDALVDRKGYLDAQASDAAAANMAFIACGIGFPGDEEVEAWLLGGDDEELMTALAIIEEGTWGADPEDFFARVGRKIRGRTLTVMQASSQAKDQATTTSTPTPSKARTSPTSNSNRQARRAAQSSKPKARAARG
ncbi:hypothetical protein [Methylobacterium iners]|uniref:Tail assembly chaperone n=1 Tax=Methylobacterium iners TaxID=418707 RepID=A0ABQ4S4J1_9HYPH|nr:hypothetical protein [Methylobacterium iners]GJD97480.1 hypothetical protein OCOJLMKI_4711 [Methylobacterium iners]